MQQNYHETGFFANNNESPQPQAAAAAAETPNNDEMNDQSFNSENF